MSIWNEKKINRKIQTLRENKDVDILVIGAGITGMTTAYYLRECNSLCVVDANIIGHGVTLNTTAKINYFQECIYTKISNVSNKDKAQEYLKSQLYAIKCLKNIIEKENIECNFKKVDSYVFANKISQIKPLEKEIKFLINNKINVIEKEMPCKVNSYKSFCVTDTYIFNPNKYINSIYKILKNNNIDIYEKTKIFKIIKDGENYLCFTDKYKIKAKKVIIACHYPFFIIPLLLPLKSYIEKSYIIVSKVKQDLNFTCISSSSPTYSCRFYNDGKNIYQISLGSSHNTSIKQNDKQNFNNVKNIFKLKNEDIVMKYSNVDIMTTDHIPFIGKIKNNMYIACGYNTWGMTNGVLAAKILSNMILNKEIKYTIFDPNRFNISNIINMPLIIASQTKSFIGSKFNKHKLWYENISFKNINGKSLAIYTDKNKNKHIVYNKCPHLGCSLIFNEKEKTWDCPCHSSRFNIDGKCIKGPSLYDISYKE